MNLLRILFDYLRRWAAGLAARRRAGRRGKRDRLLQREYYGLQVMCEYFVGAGDTEFSCDNVYLGWSPADNNAGETNSQTRFFTDLCFELLNAPQRGLSEEDDLFLQDLTVTRIFNGLRLRFAPRVQGAGVFSRPETDDDRTYLLFKLNEEGQLEEKARPRKLHRQSLFILMEKNYLLTDEDRNFTLKFCCSEKCQWLLPVS